MSKVCEGRIVAITGAGRGLGRAYALEYARQGALVVVNDLGAGPDGSGAAGGPAHDVVREIEAMGGRAAANTDDISDFAGAKRFIQTAIDSFGGLDVLVNNAGILRDRMLVNMTEDEWDIIMRVHLKGTFAPMRHAIDYWRQESKAGRQRVAAIVNTSSSSGLYANPGQGNYGAAKSGIATLTLIAAKELARLGITANAIYPTAVSRLTEGIFKMRPPKEELEDLVPESVAPIIVWLGSEAAAHITGQVFGVRGNSITLAANWQPVNIVHSETRFKTSEVGAVFDALLHPEKAQAGALTAQAA